MVLSPQRMMTQGKLRSTRDTIYNKLCRICSSSSPTSKLSLAGQILFIYICVSSSSSPIKLNKTRSPRTNQFHKQYNLASESCKIPTYWLSKAFLRWREYEIHLQHNLTVHPSECVERVLFYHETWNWACMILQPRAALVTIWLRCKLSLLIEACQVHVHTYMYSVGL